MDYEDDRGSRRRPPAPAIDMAALGDAIGAQLAKATTKRRRSEDDPDMIGLEAQIKHEGTEIILPGEPSPMALGDAITHLERLRSDLETDVAVHERIEGGHFYDGLLAFSAAMREVFGYTSALPGGFFTMPPVYIDVQVSRTDSVQAIMGRFAIPNVEGEIAVGPCNDDDGLPVAHIQGSIKKRDLPLIKKLADVARRIVREKSIYRGQAIELQFEKGKISNNPPKFVDIRGFEEPIFSAHTEAAIQANIFTPIQYSARVRQAGIPLKRGVLLEGPYGTGKTLVSRKAAQLAVANGWTFILVRDAENVAPAVEFARRFQPAIVFVEDIDREMEGEDRDEEMDHILNTLDGVDSKNSEVMVVFTSNHADVINQAMIRPGRLDAVIPIEAPDAEACLRLVKIYAGDLLQPDQDYQMVGDALAGSSPAVIREVVERAKLYAISEIGAEAEFHLPPQALITSSETMKRQIELLTAPKDEEKSPGEMFMDAIAERVFNLQLNGGSGPELAEDTNKRVKRVSAALGVG